MSFYQQGTEELLPLYDKRFHYVADYVENWWDISTIKPELVLLALKINNPKYMNCKLIF
jgi:hypothetical protein